MRILHNIPIIGPGSFGLGQVVLNLVREQNGLGVSADIWCADTEAECGKALASSGLPTETIRRFSRSGSPIIGRTLCISLEMEKAASREAANISIVHQHIVWSGLSRVTNLLRDRYGIPTVITPHGSLEKWAFKKSGWKKKLALAFYEGRNLHRASCIHTVGEKEINDIREFGLRNPVAVIPNGISNDWLLSSGNPDAFRKLLDMPHDKRMLLFLSRITPIKGLPMFLEALQRIRHKLSEWQFVIAGADEFGHQAEVRNLITRMNMNGFVTFAGPLYGQIKRDAFAAAEVLVLPSYSEGAPLVILEALGAGVPVLTTKASPWKELERFNCGWWVDISADALSEALEDVLDRSPEQLEIMGRRGKDLVADRYTWTQSARMTIELYRWLLGQAERPEFVMVD